MTQPPRVQSIVRPPLLPALLVVLALGVGSTAFAFAQERPVNAQAAALSEFQQRLNAYLKLREEMSRRLKPMSTSPSAVELAVRQESLAAAIRAARKQARPGDLIPARVAEQIAKTCLEDFHFRYQDVKRAALEEVPYAQMPVINRTYPEDAALATVPPLLLAKLPLLPDNLQYRFFGRSMVILDGDTQIIIDYVSNVLPPR